MCISMPVQCTGMVNVYMHVVRCGIHIVCVGERVCVSVRVCVCVYACLYYYEATLQRNELVQTPCILGILCTYTQAVKQMDGASGDRNNPCLVCGFIVQVRYATMIIVV